jgi:pimeloyl-ACP methyl ester carboxylesterase
MPRLTHNGADLYYELDGSGPPAVFIPGYSGHSNGVLDAAIRQALSQHHTVLVVDNRGAGQTVVDKGATVTIDDMADDIAAILDHHQMGAAHLAGISMGGCIAMTLALRHPDKARSVVSVVSAAYLNPSSRARFMMETWRKLIDGGVARDLINRYFAGVMLGDEAFQNAAFIQAWIDAPADPLAQTQAGAEQQMNAVNLYDIRDRLGQIAAPTLVMSSPEDLSIPPQYQDELAANIPNAEIKRYPGGHLFMALPTQFPRFIDDTLEFWRKHD